MTSKRWYLVFSSIWWPMSFSGRSWQRCSIDVSRVSQAERVFFCLKKAYKDINKCKYYISMKFNLYDLFFICCISPCVLWSFFHCRLWAGPCPPFLALPDTPVAWPSLNASLFPPGVWADGMGPQLECPGRKKMHHD